jgi:hypothetical protein
MIDQTSKRYNIKKVVVYTLIVLGVVAAVGFALAFLLFAPIYQGDMSSAKMSEGIAGCGSIRSAFRVYAAGHAGSYPNLTAQDASQLAVIGIAPADLAGKYFAVTDYSVTSDAATYTITATLPTYTPTQTYIIDQAGVESGTYQTGQ